MKTLLSWSSGKDSAWTLYQLQQNTEIELCGLFTTLNEEFDRVAMHGVRRRILEAQARAAGLPLHIIPLPYPCPNERYEEQMGAFVETALEQGIEAMAFGDLFLEDIRQYREEKLRPSGIKTLFPIWGLATDQLAQNMVESGLKAHLSCIDPTKLDKSFAGRLFNHDLLNDLPEGVDPCGEKGEFHTVVCEGPMFRRTIPLVAGEVVEREGFVFADFMLADDVVVAQ